MDVLLWFNWILESLHFPILASLHYWCAASQALFSLFTLHCFFLPVNHSVPNTAAKPTNSKFTLPLTVMVLKCLFIPVNLDTSSHMLAPGEWPLHFTKQFLIELKVNHTEPRCVPM